MKRTIFVGQAMPRYKEELHDWRGLNDWLFSAGVTMGQIRKNFLYSALVDYFPGIVSGGHRIPTPAEIEKERPRLAKTLKNFDPQIVVPVGRLSISYCLQRRVEPLTANVGKKFAVDPYGLLDKSLPVIAFPHPSGASTWYHKKANGELLARALELLQKEL